MNQQAKNAMHEQYLRLKPIMQREFPMLFGKAIPLIKEFRWSEFLEKMLEKRKVTCDEGKVITRSNVGAFLRCWFCRREYHLAISNNEFRIDDAGYPIQRITSEERMHHLCRYNMICKKQNISPSEDY